MAEDCHSDTSTSTSSLSLSTADSHSSRTGTAGGNYQLPKSAAKSPGGSRNQEWYWGGATKEDLAAAMEGKPDGTFGIRDASTHDGYTLTLRTGGVNRLIRITMNCDRKYGFTADTCDFTSLQELIQFYSKHSLKAFNELLDVRLLYPLRTPAINEGTTQRGNRAPRPPARRESICTPLHLVKCHLEGLHAEYERVSRHYDCLFQQQVTLNDESSRLSRLVSAYTASAELYSQSIAQLRAAVIDGEENDEELQGGEVFNTNIELQESRLNDIERAKQLTTNALNEFLASMQVVEKELGEMKSRRPLLHEERDEWKKRLLKYCKAGKSGSQLTTETFLHEVSFNLEAEPPNLTEFLLKVPLKWSPSQWMASDGDKESATKLVTAQIQKMKGREEPTCLASSDGIFLMRPSTSREGFFALVISKDGQVHNCLIEYSTDKADYSGYAFHNTNLYFSSLCDFVRYYSMISLKEHNEELDTRLLHPAYA